MKPKQLFAYAVMAGTFAGAGTALLSTGTAAASGALPPCAPKLTTAAGHPQVGYCGPASATLKINGKTYGFKDGDCSNDPANHLTLQLDLGVLNEVKSPVNNGKPYFEIQLQTSDGLDLDNISTDYGGKQLAGAATITASDSTPLSGTFKSKGFGASFSGSWDCNGALAGQ